MASKNRGWTLTLNNYSEEEYENILRNARNSKFWIFGKEIGKSGTPHIQGYIYFENPRAFAGVRKLFDNERIHWESAKGNRKQNYIYCSKEGCFETNMEDPGKPPQRIDPLTQDRIDRFGSVEKYWEWVDNQYIEYMKTYVPPKCGPCGEGCNECEYDSD